MKKATLTSPGHPNTAFEPFVKKIAHSIASVLGITYEQLTMDWSNVNYSSARAAILEVARGFKVDAGALRKQFMMPWYRAWLEEVFDKGMLVLPDGAPGFADFSDAWCGAEWIGAGKGYVDPEKEAKAAGMRIALGLSTLEIECAEQGHDYKVIISQRAKEIRLMLDAGLPNAAIGAIYGTAGVKPDPAANEDGASQSDIDNGDVDENGDELTGTESKKRRSSVPLVRRNAA